MFKKILELLGLDREIGYNLKNYSKFTDITLFLYTLKHIIKSI